MQNISFKQIGLALALSVTQTFVMGQTPSSLQITWPAERSVFQRNGNGSGGSAIISIAGQYVGDKFLDASVYRYRFVKLDPKDGVTEINIGSWSSLSKNDFGLASAKITTFMNSNILDAGWYRLDVELRKSFFGWVGKRITYATRKFGIGDVYIIAGQSNARGFEPEFELPSILVPYDNTLTENLLPDAVSVINRLAHGQPNSTSIIDFGPENGKEKIGGIPIKTGFSKYKLESIGQYPYIDPQNPTNYLHKHPVYPQGSQSWYWASLGKKLIEEAVAPKVPVIYFNTGINGSTAGSWTWADPNQNNLCLESTINMYGNLLGLRSILWHQGESDNTGGTSAATYKANLSLAIGYTRSYFNSNTQWYVSNTSYWGTLNPTTSSNVISGQNAIINDGLANRGVYTDNIDWTNGKRASWNKVHLSGAAHQEVAQRWFQPNKDNPEYTTPLKRIWEHNYAVPAKPLQQIESITYSNGSYVLTAPSGFSYYSWVENDKGQFMAINDNNAGTTRTITVNSSQNGGKILHLLYV